MAPKMCKQNHSADSNTIQNQGMMTHFDMINLIKELKTLLELLRKSLTTKPHAEPDQKKDLHPHSNETEDPKETNQTATSSRHLSYHYKTQQSSSKKLDYTERPLLTPPPKRSLWKKEFNKHKPQISLIETENKFELMETEPRKPFQTETLNTPKAG